MKTLILILVIAAFLQATILPIDLVLLILICRSYIKAEKSNLYLAFAIGLVVGHLTLAPAGLMSLIYLSIVTLTQILSASRLAGNPLLIVPIAFVFLSLSQITNLYFSHQTFKLFNLILVSLLSLPLLYLIRIWEERFIVPKDIKLKI